MPKSKQNSSNVEVRHRFKIGDLWVTCYLSEENGVQVAVDTDPDAPELPDRNIPEDLNPDEEKLWRAGVDRTIEKLAAKLGRRVAFLVDPPSDSEFAVP